MTRFNLNIAGALVAVMGIIIAGGCAPIEEAALQPGEGSPCAAAHQGRVANSIALHRVLSSGPLEIGDIAILSAEDVRLDADDTVILSPARFEFLMADASLNPMDEGANTIVEVPELRFYWMGDGFGVGLRFSNGTLWRDVVPVFDVLAPSVKEISFITSNE